MRTCFEELRRDSKKSRKERKRKIRKKGGGKLKEREKERANGKRQNDEKRFFERSPFLWHSFRFY